MVQILEKSQFSLVRKFLNDLMREDNEIKKEISIKNSSYLFIRNCCTENLFFIMKYFLKSNNRCDIKNENNFLLLATEKGHLDIVQLLIKTGIDIHQTDENGQNALHLASRYGHREIVQVLIDKGIYINQTDGEDWNALHWASLNGHTEIASLLISYKIDIQQEDKRKWKALHLASVEGHMKPFRY